MAQSHADLSFGHDSIDTPFDVGHSRLGFETDKEYIQVFADELDIGGVDYNQPPFSSIAMARKRSASMLLWRRILRRDWAWPWWTEQWMESRWGGEGDPKNVFVQLKFKNIELKFSFWPSAGCLCEIGERRRGREAQGTADRRLSVEHQWLAAFCRFWSVLIFDPFQEFLSSTKVAMTLLNWSVTVAGKCDWSSSGSHPFPKCLPRRTRYWVH